MRRYCKPIFAVMLSFLLVLLPCIQDSKAVVTTATLAAVLILTVLTAMGITLVVASSGQTKEAFLLSRGDTFMREKGYTGAFDSWLIAGSENEIALKSGFLTITALTSSRIKEFLSWLMPNAASNTIVDLTSTEVIPTSAAIITGNLIYTGSGTQFVPDSVIVPAYSVGNEFTDGTNTLTFLNNKSVIATGYYDYDGIYHVARTVYTASICCFLFRLNAPLYRPDINITYPVGIYVADAWYPNNSQTTWQNAYSAINAPFNTRAFLEDAYIEDSVEAAAIIRNYNDLDDLVDTTGVGTGGTTVVYNTYYITQSGQALNPTSQDLADIVGALQQALDDLNNRIGVIGMTVDAIAAQQVNPPYSDFQLGNLDFSGLGALLTTRFPFSIPWDLKRVFDVFVVEAEAPHWEINLFQGTSFGNQIDGTIEVDLNDYPIVGIVSRWFCIIDLCIFLAFCTKKLIWVA